MIERTLSRAWSGFRREAGLHAGAAASLSIAFLLVGAFGLLSTNLSRSFDAWSGGVELVAYLRDGTTREESVAVVRRTRALPGVAEVRLVTSHEAQRRLTLPGSPGATAFAGLPTELFPASLEISLGPKARDVLHTAAIAERLRADAIIDDVDSMPEVVQQIESFARFSGVAALVAGILALAAVVSIVSSTLLITLHRRREEIELLRLCGATDSFLRMPLLLEGTLQSMLGAVGALVILAIVYVCLREPAISLLEPFGMTPTFLPAWSVLAGLMGSALLGAAGSQVTFWKAARV